MPSVADPNSPIQFFNRYSGSVESESVYGEKYLRWAYGSPLGRLSVGLFAKRALFSRMYGKKMDQPESKEKIMPFLREYGLDTSEFSMPVDSYASFNEFFYRKLRPDARLLSGGESTASCPADGRHLVIPNIAEAKHFYVKGQRFDLERFLGDSSLARRFSEGSMLISRLCPVDYHRFHFPVSGQVGEARQLSGSLRSVSPFALRRRLSILWENRRQLTQLQAEVFDKILLVEIGATCVGRIEQTYEPGMVRKGQEKGYFAFGGSCVVTLFLPGVIRYDKDLLEYSATQQEVYIKMGDRFGVFAV